MSPEKIEEELTDLQIADKLLRVKIKSPLKVLAIIFHFKDLPGKALFYKATHGGREMAILDKAEATERMEALEAHQESLRETYGAFECESHTLFPEDRYQFAGIAKRAVKAREGDGGTKRHVFDTLRKLSRMKSQPAGGEALKGDLTEILASKSGLPLGNVAEYEHGGREVKVLAGIELDSLISTLGEKGYERFLFFHASDLGKASHWQIGEPGGGLWLVVSDGNLESLPVGEGRRECFRPKFDGATYVAYARKPKGEGLSMYDPYNPRPKPEMVIISTFYAKEIRELFQEIEFDPRELKFGRLGKPE